MVRKTNNRVFRRTDRRGWRCDSPCLRRCLGSLWRSLKEMERDYWRLVECVDQQSAQYTRNNERVVTTTQENTILPFQVLAHKEDKLSD